MIYMMGVYGECVSMRYMMGVYGECQYEIYDGCPWGVSV